VRTPSVFSRGAARRSTPHGPANPIELDAARALRFAARGVRRRCPTCGTRGIFASYFALRRFCPSCGLRFERGEPDYFLGAYLLNLVTAELVFALGFAGVLIATWPSPPWEVLEYVCAAGVVITPIVFYPFSKTLWLAIDLALRPPTARDVEQHG